MCIVSLTVKSTHFSYFPTFGDELSLQGGYQLARQLCDARININVVQGL